MIDDIADMGDVGAILAMDGSGHIAFPMNGEGMSRGIVTSTSPAKTAIYADEKIIIP